MSIDSSDIEEQELVKMAEAENEQWQRWSIYKLPAHVKRLNETAYTPQVVSFGPYHRENINLKPMEKHKDRAMRHFLKRLELNYSDCHRSLSVIVEELMDVYNWLDPELHQNSDEFLKLMIRDGIFMLEMFGYSEEIALGYASDDPIFSHHGKLHVMRDIRFDMVLLENQIPMKVLYTLYGLQLEAKREDVNGLVLQFFYPGITPSFELPDFLHIVDMFQRVLPVSPTKTVSGFTKLDADIVRSAVELQDAGIKIKRSRDQDISFEKGILQLPMIVVNDLTELLFLNLVAYERFHPRAGNDVTTYVFFLSNIIRDASDVRLLHSRDIIQNRLGTDEEVVKLFHSLSKGLVVHSDTPLAAIYVSVNAYCNTKISKFRASFARLFLTYFNGKWAIISIAAAVLLFALTTTQTVYAIREFYRKK